jgi:hypothetical protein
MDTIDSRFLIPDSGFRIPDSMSFLTGILKSGIYTDMPGSAAAAESP